MIDGMSVEVDVTRIKDLLVEKGFRSQREFAKSIGMDGSQFSHILSCGYCRAGNLFRIEKGFGLDPGALRKLKSEKITIPQYYRQSKDLSVSQLSKMSGISTSIINRIERGRDCHAFSAACLSRVLGIPMGVYLGYED